jgi:two-component system OmpR family response regulator
VSEAETVALRREAAHILIVDDDGLVREMLARYFEGKGFRVSEAADGAAMRETLARAPVDLILLDLVMPGEDGLTLAREVRSRSDVSIVMLTSLDDVTDRVTGLEVGADDYLTKPFHPREVLARVRAVLRRARPAAFRDTGNEEEPAVYRFKGWELHAAMRWLVAPDGREVPLTTGEFELLLTFVTHPGHVLDRNRLMNLIKGRKWAAFDRSIDQQVARLRRKIEADPSNPSLIKSVRSAGYLFAAQVRRS